jgi:hypothetical protein
MDLFCKAIGMVIDIEKTMMTLWGIFEQEKKCITLIFSFKT